ncbi:MAG: hypothetical protein SNH55_03910 [Rikenellaceae bacterium]
MKNFTKSAVCAIALCAATMSSAEAQVKPDVNVGLLMHTYGSAEQIGFGGSTAVENGSDWSYGANLLRSRFMFDVKLTDKDYFFVESELTASVGLGTDKAASIKVLDARYDHKFSDLLTVSAGKILVSYNRNGIQGAGTLMANNFSYFQYTASGALNNDSGRDIGVNLSGTIIEDKLKYRVGAFSGRREFTNSDSAPLRYVGRLQYNFLDDDKYTGTNIGNGETFTIAAGFDTQGTYKAFGIDAFLDVPLGSAGSVTCNAAYSYMTGGDDLEAEFTFADVVPEQNIVFAELGYYFKESKLQPWVKYELQDTKYGADESVVGGGINYFFNGYRTNLRLSYIARENSLVNKMYSQVWLQLQLFIF